MPGAEKDCAVKRRFIIPGGCFYLILYFLLATNYLVPEFVPKPFEGSTGKGLSRYFGQEILANHRVPERLNKENAHRLKTVLFYLLICSIRFSNLPKLCSVFSS